jgi:glucose/arabinose dehydrogenase
VYFSFSESGPRGKGVALATGTFNQASDGTTQLKGVRTIFRATPYVEGNGHYSGRIAFSPDGKYLFFTNGERQKFDPAQDPKSTLGKVLRLNSMARQPLAILWRRKAFIQPSGPMATATC